ncbi:MAG: hypothetical protein KDB35_22970 [Acidimicrobiales bacterium]|nr:hypothetical protein [Acidimicrobiales bacterium]
MGQRWRNLFVLVGLLAGAAGLGLVVGFFAVAVPGRRDPTDASIQPSPDWIWQLGVALGAVAVFGMWRITVHARNSDEKFIDVSDGAAKAAGTAAFVSIAGGLMVAAAFSPDSVYRDRPLFVVPFVALGAIWFALRS